MSVLPPLSLYIHVPWCVRKCPYCDFNSHKAEEHIPEAEYVQALLDDLAAEAKIITENNKKRDLCGLVRAKIAHGVELKDSSGIEICGLVKK